MSDFISGSIGGLVGVIISHPIDTIKTRIQLNNTLNVKTAFKMGNFYSELNHRF